MEKIKQWIIAHKLVSIITASALVVCITLAIVLPITLSHKHTYSESWSTNETTHWHACTGEDCEKTKDNAEHAFTTKTDATYHWQECSVCGYKKNSAEHTFVEKHNTTQYWSECSACGYQQEKIEAKVEASVISNALQLKDAEGNEYTNWQAEDFDNLTQKNTRKTKFTGASLYTYNVEGTEIKEQIAINFTQNDAPKYSVYIKDNTAGKWNKATIDGVYSDMYNSAKLNTFGYDLHNDWLTATFEYNEETNTYSATRTVNIGDAEQSISETATLKFANGKLVSIHIVRTATDDDDQSSITKDITWTISYGNVKIDLPADNQTTHVHTYSSNWSADATHHWHACMDDDCDSVTEKAEHSFGTDGKCTTCQKKKLNLSINMGDSVTETTFQRDWIVCDETDLKDPSWYGFEYYSSDGSNYEYIGDSFPREEGYYKVKIIFDGNDTYLPAEAEAEFMIG